MSCHYQGTPGAPPLTSCSVSCVIDICRGNGDNNVTCDTSKDVCDCYTIKSICINTITNIMAPPINCQANSYKDKLLDNMSHELIHFFQ